MGLHRGDHSRPGRERASAGGRALNALVTAATPALDAELVPPTMRLADDPVPAEVAYQLVHDELLLDGNARLNLATFVTTWMEPQAARLMAECADKNMIDKDEYPQTAELERRCVAILADLWHAPDPAGRWAARPPDPARPRCWPAWPCSGGGPARTGDRSRRPNLVMGANVQVCWEKFCRYWDVEPRLVPMEGERFHLGAQRPSNRSTRTPSAWWRSSGSTFDGSYEPIAEICAALDELQAGPAVRTSPSTSTPRPVASSLPSWIPTWCGTSGCRGSPRSTHPATSTAWCIRASAGRCGATTAALPEELVFDVNYLGGNMPTFALNFSRPGAEVVAQYYNFFRLGRAGYTAVQSAARDVATTLAAGIEGSGPFRLLSRGDQLPVFAFTTKPGRRRLGCVRRLAVVARTRLAGARLHLPGQPAGPLGPALVVRNGFGHDLADLLLNDLRAGRRAVEQAGRRRPAIRSVWFPPLMSG